MSRKEQSLLASLTEIVRDGRAAIIGPIRQEILSGIKDMVQFGKISEALEAFPDEPLSTDTYIEAARLFNFCRAQGVQCGPVDMLICAVARQRGLSILTNDRSLLACFEALRKEKSVSSSAKPAH